MRVNWLYFWLVAHRKALSSCLAHGKLTDGFSTEEQHPGWMPDPKFLVVLRARGDSAGGAASCPGLGELG
jgi:hypothetical protein